METPIYLSKVAAPKENHYYLALEFSIKFVNESKQPFSSENLIAAYLDGENPIPKESRVWGAVVKELLNRKLIVHAGFARYEKSSGHKKPINIWKKAS